MHDPHNSAEHTGNPDQEPKPSFISLVWGFIIEPKHSNALVAIFTVLIFFTGLAYTIVSVVQAFQMQQALKLTRSDQRAWIRVDYPGFESLSVPITVKFTNVGKSPALRIGANTVVEIVKSQNQPSFLDIPKRHSGMFTGLVFPSEHIEYPAELFNGNTEQSVPRLLNTSELDSLRAGESYIAVYGTVMYSDQFGLHWTRFCNWRVFAETDKPRISGFVHAGSCTAFNETGDGPAEYMNPGLFRTQIK